jgi:phosphatidylserine/phosphatidylglycerophosphate/cardiolipin synthase-like enzyme
MRASTSKDGLTLRAIAGTYNILLGIDLEEAKRAGCLGFSIWRTELGAPGAPPLATPPKPRALPNSLRFPGDKSPGFTTTEIAPLQKFRWGDYTVKPGQRYRFKVTARYGQPGQLTDGATAEIEVTTEDPASPKTPIFFNRGAAASQAYNAKYGQLDPDKLDPDKRADALKWLSRGLEEAILAFLDQAKDGTFALHAAIYEFQKPELLAGLKRALDRGVEVKVAYHYRHKNDDDTTWKKNEAAAQAQGLEGVATHRQGNPQSAIMHNKFVVLLKKDAGGALQPQAVWTGSTNWTEGGIYGQLNVGHAVYDPAVAAIYEQFFELLRADTAAQPLKAALGKLTPVPKTCPPGPGLWPIFSPQGDTTMLDLYGAICKGAKCLLVCAPFELADQISHTFSEVPAGTLHYLLADKESSFGSKNEIEIVERSKQNEVAFAATLRSPLTDFQEKLLQKDTPEHYHHTGIHIHSKIIIADPFGDDPILVTGSANFSNNSTVNNDSNSLLIRGDKGITDIYATEFMRMFEHYHFRAARSKAEAATKAAGKPVEDEVLTLATDASWSDPYYVEGSDKALDRKLFAGTL